MEYNLTNQISPTKSALSTKAKVNKDDLVNFCCQSKDSQLWILIYLTIQDTILNSTVKIHIATHYSLKVMYEHLKQYLKHYLNLKAQLYYNISCMNVKFKLEFSNYQVLRIKTKTRVTKTEYHNLNKIYIYIYK